MTGFPLLTDALRLQRLRPPSGPVRMVLDTDTYNEIDDQFAVVYALLSPEKLSVEALYAAPFQNDRAASPAEGMHKSYEEIGRLYDRLPLASHPPAFLGSTRYFDASRPEESPAVADLIERASNSTDDDPLYVVAIGAITNIANAVALEPRIVEKIVVVWLGGHGLHWPHNHEFNLRQDVAATRLLLDCGVPFVMVPAQGVASHLITTKAEIDRFVGNQGAIGAYLAEIFTDYADDHFGWSKVIWDISVIGWLINDDWVPTLMVHSPVLTDQLTWSVDQRRHQIRYAYSIWRDPIYRDLFQKLADFAD